MQEARVRQEIVIHTLDRVGVLAEVTRLLCDMGINVHAIQVVVEGEWARLHLVTSSQSYASEALRDAGFNVSERDVVVIELPHHPGFLCRINEALARKKLTIESLHATVPEGASTGLVVFSCSNNLHAAQLLRGR